MKRYASFAIPLTLADGTVILSGLPFVDFIYTGRIYHHIVKETEKGRLDLISYKFLSDSTLWPYIAWYNSIMDPITEVTIGSELQIPVDLVDRLNDIKAFAYR